MITTMVRDCGWCKKILGEKEGLGSTGPTSGICPECLHEHFPDIAEEVIDRINRAPE